MEDQRARCIHQRVGVGGWLTLPTHALKTLRNCLSNPVRDDQNFYLEWISGTSEHREGHQTLLSFSPSVVVGFHGCQPALGGYRANWRLWPAAGRSDMTGLLLQGYYRLSPHPRRLRLRRPRRRRTCRPTAGALGWTDGRRQPDPLPQHHQLVLSDPRATTIGGKQHIPIPTLKFGWRTPFVL